MYEDRIQIGINWLNVHYPGWRHRLDYDRLDVRSPHHCLYAQLGFKPTREEARERGMYLHIGQDHDWNNYDELYDILTSEWLTAIFDLNRQEESQALELKEEASVLS